MTRHPGIFLALLLGGPALADDVVKASSQADIQKVITAQIEAFRRDDGAAALAFAAPGIVQRFGDGPHFIQMVRTAYPAVYRPRRFSFGDLAANGDSAEQKVEFIGADGEAALGLYEMEHEADGTWRIAGCMLEKSERVDL